MRPIWTGSKQAASVVDAAVVLRRSLQETADRKPKKIRSAGKKAA
jgi:hypothetical protein